MRPDTLVYPQFSALPMGWSWAVYWCQNLHRRVIDRLQLFSPAQYISDKCLTPDLHGGSYTVYLDNFIAMGTDQKWMQDVTAEVTNALESAGLPTHEQGLGVEKAQLLG